jgi:hypothetical protein
MSKLLKTVTQTKDIRNKLSEKTFNLPIWEFLMKCYETCTPNKYGQVFPKKLSLDTKGKVIELSPTLDRGDLHINYKLYFEGKISYKGLKGKYNITNIRPWQKLNYFILCFIDTDNKFQPEFYCVPKWVVVDNPELNLTGMNNANNINQFNTYVGMRVTIKSEDIEWLFKKHSVLKDTSYKSLLRFITTEYSKLKIKQNAKTKKR